LANGTDGELITWSACAIPTTVTVGTCGQVLTSNGAGAAPTFQAVGLCVSTGTSTPIVDDASGAVGGCLLITSEEFVLPSCKKFYKITDVEWKNGGVVCGNVKGGVIITDSCPPTNANIIFAGTTVTTAQGSACTTQKVAITRNVLLLGAGMKIQPFIAQDNGTGQFRKKTKSSVKAYQSGFNVAGECQATPFRTNGWSNTTTCPSIKIYWEGYS